MCDERRCGRWSRTGSDEFTVIYAVSPVSDLEATARRAVALVHGSAFDAARDAGLRVTVSVRGLSRGRERRGPHAVLERADQAMYASKRRGGDGFHVLPFETALAG